MRNIAIADALALVAAVVAGAAIWWFAVRDDAELATEAPDVPTDLVQNETPEAPSDDVQTFRIIPERLEAADFADEELASLPLPSTAKGATNEIEGEFYLMEDGLALASEPPSTFTVDLRALTSDESRRDNRVQDALETTQFPMATFTIMDVAGYDPAIPDGEEQNLLMTGMLDIHGVQREVTWDVQARREANVITALATVGFLYADFDITPPNIAGFVSVADDVTLQVQIVAEAV